MIGKVLLVVLLEEEAMVAEDAEEQVGHCGLTDPTVVGLETS